MLPSKARAARRLPHFRLQTWRCISCQAVGCTVCSESSAPLACLIIAITRNTLGRSEHQRVLQDVIHLPVRADADVHTYTRLEHLDASQNCLAALPGALPASLTRLTLTANWLTDLPALAALPNLRWLSAGANRSDSAFCGTALLSPQREHTQCYQSRLLMESMLLLSGCAALDAAAP